MDFFTENYDWIFSGIGVFVISVAIKIIFRESRDGIVKRVHGETTKRPVQDPKEYIKSHYGFLIDNDSRFKFRGDTLIVFSEKLWKRLLLNICIITLILLMIGALISLFITKTVSEIFETLTWQEILVGIFFVWMINELLDGANQRMEISLVTGKIRFLPGLRSVNIKQLSPSKHDEEISRTSSYLWLNFGNSYRHMAICFKNDSDYQMLKRFMQDLKQII